jgi:pimeloyl-ACP methyl ester carboxylesterase
MVAMLSVTRGPVAGLTGVTAERPDGRGDGENRAMKADESDESNAPAGAPEEATMAKHRARTIDGLSIFYREAGDRGKPAIVLLHGFPTSSHMYRHLIPALAPDFHVIAPDYPGFGLSAAPSPSTFPYTFDRLADVMEKLLLTELQLETFGLFVQDYGSPVGFRLATRHPDRVQWLVVQNGNAYEEGFTGFWSHLREQYWQNPSRETEAPLRGFLTPDAARWIYTAGARDVEQVSPDNWIVDLAALSRPESERIQLDLFYDYRTNVAQYPVWQQYLRAHKPPTLVVWGKNDPIFAPEGAEAFRSDVPEAEIHLLDTGHFALEEDLEPIVGLMREFYTRRVRGGTLSGARSSVAA